MKQAYQNGTPEALVQASSLLRSLLSLLRALDWHYRTAHWQVWGEAQYGDHLMFQRFYEAMPDEIDTLAEKMVGIAS
jgi:DNA-binding ferritin-like protein